MHNARTYLEKKKTRGRRAGKGLLVLLANGLMVILNADHGLALVQQMKILYAVLPEYTTLSFSTCWTNNANYPCQNMAMSQVRGQFLCHESKKSLNQEQQYLSGPLRRVMHF